MNRVAVTAIALAAMTAPAMAEPPTDPFGFRFGSSISEYNCKASEAIGHFECAPVRLHPDFTTYRVYAMPSVGVCSVHGSKNYANSALSFGIDRKLTEQLSERFGLNFRMEENPIGYDYVDDRTYEGYQVKVTYLSAGPIVAVSAAFLSPLVPECRKEVAKAEGDAF